MQPNVPIPTDNLNKFLATFGLAIIIASLVGLFLVYKTSNDELYLIADRLYELTKDGADESDARKDMMSIYEKRVAIVSANKRAYLWVLFTLFAIGWTLSIIGFERWKKTQVLNDELLELQVAKARMEVHKVNEYRDLPPKPPTKKRRTGKKPMA